MSDGAVNRMGNQIANVNDLTPQEVRSRREMQLRAIDQILDLIGPEYIKLFLPMWETYGTTLKDLLKPDLTFTVSGALLNQDGPFGKCVYCDGVNDSIQQDPIIDAYATISDSTQQLEAPTAVAVQKLKTFTNKVSFIRVKIFKTGEPDGNVHLEIRTAKDGAAIANGTSVSFACASVGGGAERRGFNFAITPILSKATTYYLALVYDGNTNAAAGTSIGWSYDSAGGYGQGRNYFDGAGWTDTVTNDHAFQIYDDRLQIPDDWSLIVCAKALMTGLSLYGVFGGAVLSSNTRPCICYNTSGYVELAFCDTITRYCTPRRWPLNDSNVWGVTFSKASGTAKTNAFLNGVFQASGDGAAATAHQAITQPWTIGSCIYSNGTTNGFFKGYVGPAIMASRTLTPAEVAKVSHNLLVMRKLREAV